MLVFSREVFVIFVLFSLTSVTRGANINRASIKNVKDDDVEAEELEDEESDVDENVHVVTNNQRSDTKHDDSDADDTNHDDSDSDETKNDNSDADTTHDETDDNEETDDIAEEATAAGDGGGAENSKSEFVSSLVKDINEAKEVNKKLQGEMDALNSKLVEVLKSSDTKKQDESDNVLSKSQGLEEDTKGEEQKDTKSDSEKDMHVEGRNAVQKIKSQINAGGTDGDDAGKRYHEENLHNSEIGEDRNVEVDPDY